MPTLDETTEAPIVPDVPSSEELLMDDPEVSPKAPFSFYEREYLSSFPLATRKILMEDPTAVHNATRAAKAMEIKQSSTTGISFDDALLQAEDLLNIPEDEPLSPSMSPRVLPKVLESTPEVASTTLDLTTAPSPVGIADVSPVDEDVGYLEYAADAATGLLKAAVRVPSTTIVRLADNIKVFAIAPLMDVVNRQFKLEGREGPISPEIIALAHKRLPKTDEELLTTYGSLVPSSGALETIATDMGATAVGYVAVAAVAELAIPAAILAEIGVVGTAVATKVGPKIGGILTSLGQYLRIAGTGIVSGSVLGPEELMSEVASPRFKEYLQSKSEGTRMGIRLTEQALSGAAVDAALPYIKSAFSFMAKRLRTDQWVPTLKSLIDYLDPKGAMLPEFPPAVISPSLPDFPMAPVGQQPSLRSQRQTPADLKQASKERLTNIKLETEAEPLRRAMEVSDAAIVASDNAVFEKVNGLYKRIEATMEVPVAGGTPDITVVPTIPEVPLAPKEVIKKVAKTKTSKVKPAVIDEPKVVTPVSTGIPEVAPTTELSKAAKTRIDLTGSPTDVKLGKNAMIVAESISDAEAIAKVTKGSVTTPALVTKALVDEGVDPKTAAVYSKALGELRDPSGTWLSRTYDSSSRTFKDEGYSAAVVRHTQRKGTPTVTPEIIPEVAPTGAGAQEIKDASSLKMLRRNSGALGITVMGQLPRAMLKAADPLAPLLLPSLAFVADMTDGKRDLSMEDYLLIAGAGMGLKFLGAEAVQAYRGLSTVGKDFLKAQMSVGQVEVLALAKSVLLTPEGVTRARFTIAEDLLSNVVPKATQWLDRIDRALPQLNANLINRAIDMTPIVDNFSTGVVSGIKSLVHKDALTTPATMLFALEEAVNHVHVATAMKQVTPAVEAMITQRWTKFTKAFQMDQTAIDTLDQMVNSITGTGNLARNRQTLMISLDSIEQKLFDGLAKAAHDPTIYDTIAGRAELSKHLGKMQLFKHMTAGLSNIMSPIVHGPMNQILTAEFLKQAPADMTLGIGMKRMVNDMDGRIPQVRAFIDASGLVPEVLRDEFYDFIGQLQQAPTGKRAYETFVAGTYHMMLSSWNFVRNSIVGNTMSQVRLLTSKSLALATNTVRGDVNGALIASDFIEGHLGGFLNGVRNAAHAIRTGTSLIDPTGDKVFYRHTVVRNSVHSFGGTDTTVPLWSRAYTRMGELIGIKPGDIARAVDILPQTMAHAGHLQELITEEAVRISEASAGATSLFVARQAINSDPTKLAELSALALKYSRGSVFKGAAPMKLLSNQTIKHGESVVGQGIEAVTNVQRSSALVGAVQPFMSTSAFARFEGARYSPYLATLLEATIAKGSSIPWAKVFNPEAYRKLPNEVRLAADRYIVDLGARVVTGITMSGAILAGMTAAGWHYTSPLFSGDKDLKNQGVKANSLVHEESGTVLDLSLFEDWTPTMALLDSSLRILVGDTDLVSQTEGITAGLFMEMILSNVSPQVVSDFYENMSQLSKQPMEEGSKSLQYFSELVNDVVMRMSPQMLKNFTDWGNGYVTRRATTPREIFTEGEPMLTITGKTKGSSPFAVIGNRTTIPTESLDRTLAANGVTTDKAHSLTFGGLKITDQKLLNKVLKSMGTYMDENKGDGLFRPLEATKDPVKREKIAKDFVARAKSAGFTDNFGELEALKKLQEAE